MQTITVQGVEVPALGLGTWQLTGDDCERGVAHALSVGYRHIDTAQMYGNEAQVGAGLAGSSVDRDEVFLTTKIDNRNHAPDAVRSSTEESLRKLGTDHVDLLLIHWPVGDVPIEDTLDAMVGLVDAGEVRHVGVSNFTPEQVERAVAHAGIFANQVEFHPFLGQDALRDLAVAHDHMLTAYSPLARGDVFDDETLTEVARAHGADPAQVALRWLLSLDHVAAIPKATSADHIESNYAAQDITLTDDEIARISGLARGQRLVDPPFAPW